VLPPIFCFAAVINPMPFTFSHPAAILPLARFRRGPYALSALIIGSMTPDLEYFFSFRHSPIVAHSLLGLVVFCLPVGILALWCFHSFVKQPARLLLPKPLRYRLAELSTLRPHIASGQGLLLVLLVGAGAATHIVWDNFTNQRSGIVARIPAFHQTVMRMGGIDFNLCDIVQQGSTAAGLGIVACSIWLWMRRRPMKTPVDSDLPNWLRRIILLFLCGLSILVALIAGEPGGVEGGAMRWATIEYDRVAVVAMAVLMFGLLLYTAIFHWSKHCRNSLNPPPTRSGENDAEWIRNP
jgi:hypothetical protein